MYFSVRTTMSLEVRVKAGAGCTSWPVWQARLRRALGGLLLLLMLLLAVVVVVGVVVAVVTVVVVEADIRLMGLGVGLRAGLMVGIGAWLDLLGLLGVPGPESGSDTMSSLS